MNQKSDHNETEIFHSWKVMRDTSSSAYGCLFALVVFAALLAGILFAKSQVDRRPLSTNLEITMYIAAFVAVGLLLFAIHLRIRANFTFTIGRSDDGKIVITVNDPKDPKIIEGPFQIDYFYFESPAYAKTGGMKMKELRLIIKKEDKCCLVMHEVYGGLKSSPNGWNEIFFNKESEFYGDEEYQKVHYTFTGANNEICEKLIPILKQENG